MLASQELSRSNDESSGDENVGEIEFEMKIHETSWSNFGGGQDAGNEVEMVQAYDREMHGCPSAKV